jgi:putative FmdB family regulatory protein
MPTYDYLCPNGHRFEVIHSVTADGPESCPVCGAAPVRKAFTAPTIHFKGTGWAKKDRSSTSRSAGSSATSGSDGGSSSSSASGDGSGAGSKDGKDAKGGSDSKPAPDASTAPAKASGSSGSSTGGAASD